VGVLRRVRVGRGPGSAAESPGVPAATVSWLTAYRRDVARYTEYAGGRSVTQVLTQQGLWALFQYRLAAAVYAAAWPGPIKRFALLWLVAWQKVIEITTGISLPYTALIGPGLYIGHFGNIILHGEVVIGSECNLSQGVTIGVSGRGARRGVPQIGDRVYIGTNAVVVGGITIGNDVLVGANTLVIIDIPDHCTVVGVPGAIVNHNGSQEYLHPR